MIVDVVLAKIFGTKHEREIKRIKPLVALINDLEPQMSALSDAELTAKTQEFREKLANGATLDDLLVEAFAAVREASRRVLKMRHFDVQLIGGIVLHRGKISEMKTGEGKTLAATLPVYLNGLSGAGVHVVTVNDYLARRDSEWMGRLYKFMGLTVGLVVHGLDDEERKASYACDITYGTNNEFGFDYLRDNMKFRLDDCTQRGHNYAIVDEVDSILIDEARTPLIISGPSEESTDKYYKANTIIPRLIRGEVIEGKEPGEKYYTGDYTVDEKHRVVALTEEGFDKVAKLLGLPDIWSMETQEWKHHIEQALRAHVLYKRDRDYLVKWNEEEGKDEVVIVDEFTGRLMPGRRWSDGLHQAIESKEGVKIERENQTLATITFQNYFRMYKKLAGMTGTADTEAAEFGKIYKLDVVVIPTNQAMIRKDLNDIVYRTEEEKWRNAAKEIEERHKKGQPVLVGTVSVEKSEKLSGILKRMGVRHEVLNAKNHEREAYIVAQAGRKSQVTVSTNMAGRGTDILLGGNPENQAQEECLKKKLVETPPPGTETVTADEHFYYFSRGERTKYRVAKPVWDEVYARCKAVCEVEHEEVVQVGGLHICGTERHESRRVDNQLRGRAGRQGDPGSSRFFLSLQDDLLRLFGGERIQGLMLRLGMEEDVPIESRMISKRIQGAQQAVEAQNFSMRKHVLEYDDVMNKQRQAVYGLRRQLLEGADHQGAHLRHGGRHCGGGHRHPLPGAHAAAPLGPGWSGNRHQLAVRRARSGQGTIRERSHGDRAADSRYSAPTLRGKRGRGGSRDHALHRAHDHAQPDRPAVEGQPAVDGPHEGRDRHAGLRAEGPAGRVQEGSLHSVPGHDEPHRGRDGAVPVLPAAGARRDARCADARGRLAGRRQCGRRRLRGQGTARRRTERARYRTGGDASGGRQKSRAGHFY